MEADGDHETLLMTSAPYAAAYDYWEAEEREERALDLTASRSISIRPFSAEEKFRSEMFDERAGQIDLEEHAQLLEVRQ